MHKKTWAKLSGFVVAAACTAGLVAYGAGATGAYFSASSDGTITGTTGSVHVNTTTSTLNFAGLMPGDYQTKTFDYNVGGSTGGLYDVYLEFDGVDAFQHTPQAGPTPLGRYGHLAVSGPNGSFSSFNLAADPGPVATPPVAADPTDCKVDQYGRSIGGGQTAASTSTTDNSNGYCPAPQFILLSYGAQPSDSNVTASITFGFTGLLTDPLAQHISIGTINYKVVAVQHNVSPYNNQLYPTV